MSKLNYSEIEKKWQKYWKENQTNKTNDDFSNNRNKFYILDMFPYPSGEGLHVGHPKGYIATDIYSRLKKMQGFNVLHPMGWDAFGLPAEQFAIKNKINPNIATAKNVARYKEQIEMLGLNYDWDREVNTTDPKYYKWTQWMFKQMYKDGLAYESFEPINWCPSCKTGLSNEDLDGNACERCGTIVEKKPLRQWVIKITDYADRLLTDIDKLNWEPHIKELQRNWIGKSVGSEIDFEILSPNVFGFDLKTIYDEGDKNYKNDRKRTVAIIKIKGTDKFLGFKKPNDVHIYLPGGGKELGENCIENAIRETKEEIGITGLVHISPIATFRNGEYYELFEIEEVFKTLPSELDQKGNILVEFTKEEILKNNFAQVSYIFNNLEDLVKKSFKENKLKIFTTRADTLFGCTFMCISYTLAKEWIRDGWNATPEIKNFIAKLEKEEKERTIDFDMSKLEKEGIDTGIKAVNPANGEEVPIYIANYILSDYGTGAIMAVPAHDERDFEFAKKYNLEIREVLIPERIDKRNPPVAGKSKIERVNVQVLVKNLNTGKYLCLHSNKFNWNTLPMGGVNEGEDIFEAAKREVAEETGYHNLINPKKISGDVRAEYFAAHKDVNRVSFTSLVYFELKDEDQLSRSEEEIEANEIIWIDEKDFNSEFMVHAEMDIWLARLNNPNYLFTDEGVLVNSNSFGSENVKDIVTVGEILPDAKEVYGSSVIAYDKNKNLFLKLNNLNVNETWLASGGVNDGESYKQCALRELQEEAGISKVDNLVDLGAPIIAYYFNPNKNSNRKSFGYNYLAFVDSNQEIKSSNEAHEKYSTEWVSFEELYNSIANIKPESHHWLIALKRAKAFIDNNFDGMNSEEARVKITEKVGGKVVSKYKLKDWVFARQRYWGEPFPIVFDENRKSYAVADKELPVILPNVENYEPTDNGESPLANIKDWVEVYGFINEDGEFESISGAHSERELKTINTYKENFETYISETVQEVSGEWKQESDFIVEKLKGRKVLEIGSASGRDADYFKKHGIDIITSDIVDSFSKVIKDKNLEFLNIDPLVDDFHNEKYDGILSISSLLHSEKYSFEKIINKINLALNDDGYLYLRLKNGEGELEEDRKGGYRFFSFFNENELKNILQKSGFEIEKISYLENNKWINILAKKSKTLEIKKFYRETNTMPQWAGSSWYYLRYIDPKNDQEFVDKELEKNWSPVDFYVGGAEHATRHLIYARFWHKFLFDKGFVSYDEPFSKLQTVGLIMAEDGKKMSKRYGNVVNPDDVVKEFGADAMRTYEMFMGPFEKAIAWNTNSIAGVSRFLERVSNLIEKVELKEEIVDSKEIERVINETIKKVGEDVEGFKFNTAIAQMMICINSFEDEIKKGNKISRNTFSDFIQILSLFAVHICEEIWQNVLGNNFSIHASSWPKYDEAKIIKEEIEMSLQISGKFRGTFFVKNNLENKELKEFIKNLDLYKKYILDESEIKNIIIVENRLINIVI